MARGKNEKGKGGYWELAMDTSKSHRKRLRRNRNSKFKTMMSSSSSKNRIRKCHNRNTQVTTTTENKVPDIDMPNQENPQPTLLQQQEQQQQTHSITSEEELLNDIAANITANACQNPTETSIFVSEITAITSNEIFFADEIPQCITDDVVLSSSSSTSSNPIGADGPSVIVEYLPTMDTFDENELNGLINLNEQELIERFLNCGDDHEIFVN